jgi:hypothetical protein
MILGRGVTALTSIRPAAQPPLEIATCRTKSCEFAAYQTKDFRSPYQWLGPQRSGCLI